MAEVEGNAPILQFNAARLVELESQRNKYLKEEIELGKRAQQILTLFKRKTSKRFVYVLLVVAISLAIAVWLDERPFALILVIWSFHCFGCLFWIGIEGPTSILILRDYQMKLLIDEQMLLARMAESEFVMLNVNENIEVAEGLGEPLICLRSFVARGPKIEIEELRREMKSFVWKKCFHCFLLLLFVASLVIRFGVIHY